MTRPIGAAVADVQVVPHFFHGALSSAVIGVALKRAFWDLEDVLASVGIAKSSGGCVCTDLPYCPEFKRNENNSLASNMFKQMRMSLFREQIPFRRGQYHGGRNYYGGQIDSDYMENALLIFFFITPLCKIRPAGRKTRVVTLTTENCVSGDTIANFLDRGLLS